MPVNSQDYGVGNEAAEGKGREWGDHGQPREGRMAQSHSPSITNSRGAQPTLEREEQAHTGLGEARASDMEQQTRQGTVLTFLTPEDVQLKSCCSKLYWKHI